jgi:hypothetical protein
MILRLAVAALIASAAAACAGAAEESPTSAQQVPDPNANVDAPVSAIAESDPLYSCVTAPPGQLCDPNDARLIGQAPPADSDMDD